MTPILVGRLTQTRLIPLLLSIFTIPTAHSTIPFTKLALVKHTTPCASGEFLLLSELVMFFQRYKLSSYIVPLLIEKCHVSVPMSSSAPSQGDTYHGTAAIRGLIELVGLVMISSNQGCIIQLTLFLLHTLLIIQEAHDCHSNHEYYFFQGEVGIFFY